MTNTEIQRKPKGNRRCILIVVKNRALRGDDMTAELRRLIRAYEQEIVQLYEKPKDDGNRKHLWDRIKKLTQCRNLASDLLEKQTEAKQG